MIGRNDRHESAVAHVTGQAQYVDDLPEPVGLLHAVIGMSSIAKGRIISLNLEEVRHAPGVTAIVTAQDIPGDNDISATHRHDEPLLAEDHVQYLGQPVFAVAARTRAQARRAALLARIAYEPETPSIDVADAEQLVTEPMQLARGDVDKAMQDAPVRLQGRMRIGGQEHFYLESHIGLALMEESSEMVVYSSTQHPSEVQTMIGGLLGLSSHAVTVRVRRMGGAFGGKETQGNLFAGIAAVLACKTGQPVKCRPDRDDDMVITGKRHDFDVDYDVGFTPEGDIQAVDMTYAARCGWSADLSGPVTDRALFHADNAYFYPHVRLNSRPMKTNTPSNTAFRGFGGPQGMIGAERLIDEVAFATGQDPLDVRLRNLYGEGERAVTPYHQTINQHVLAEIMTTLRVRCDYDARRKAIRDFNSQGGITRRGLALTPVKFGISFTLTAYNQAGALVHIYKDGSIAINHGGTEMGQGLHTKMLQVAASTLGVSARRVRISATDTGKVPNTSATAASSGADLNGKAVEAACQTILSRLKSWLAGLHDCDETTIRFRDDHVLIGDEARPFDEVIREAYFARISLSSTGYYKTPGIHWDRNAGRGEPFFYFACGAACSEISIDSLTGEFSVDRVDILHDCGRSLNPAIDRGQIEGGFVQGMGWLTTEELVYSAEGRLETHAPSTYKIPAIGDTPAVFNVDFFENGANAVPTIGRSKAVGEPPLMLAMSALHALSDAIASFGDYQHCPRLDPPATPEAILRCVERVRQLA